MLDTTVLVYAVGSEHPLRDSCQRLIRASLGSRLTTTAGVIQEFVHVRSRCRPRTDATGLAIGYFQLFSPLLSVPDLAVRDALDLIDRHDDLGAFDAMLAAAARFNGCRALVTADRAFAAIDQLNVVFPDADGVDRLVG